MCKRNCSEDINKMLEVKFYENVADELLKFAVIISKANAAITSTFAYFPKVAVRRRCKYDDKVITVRSDHVSFRSHDQKLPQQAFAHNAPRNIPSTIKGKPVITR